MFRGLNSLTVDDLGPGFRAEADALLDQVLTDTEFDAQATIANVYPLKMVRDALGLDVENRETLPTFGDLAFSTFGPQNTVLARAREKAAAVDAVDYMTIRI